MDGPVNIPIDEAIDPPEADETDFGLNVDTEPLPDILLRKKASGNPGAAVLGAALLGLAEVIEPPVERDETVEVAEASTDDDLLDLSFGDLEPLD